MLSSLLLFADYKFNQVQLLRSTLENLAVPFYWVLDAPQQLLAWGGEQVRFRDSLVEENARLRSESLVLKAKLQRSAVLVAENGRLRSLLNSSTVLENNDVGIVRIIGVSPVISKHEVIINKGTDDGVYASQPVLDANGLFGQVIDATPFTARVLLISDAVHGVPVRVQRTGMRTVAEGVGDFHRLRLSHIAPTTDLQIGDQLVTSGLGGVFPEGYPVAKIASVERVASQPFLTVTAKPTAELDQADHLLLVFDHQHPIGF